MKDTTIYDNKTLQDLLRDVDSLAGSRRGKIIDLIDALRKFMQTPEDAAVFAPMIKDYLDVWIKNDEHLIKMGTIVQRILAAESNQGSGDLSDILTDLEKEQLQRDAVAELTQDVKVVDADLAALEETVTKKIKPKSAEK